MSLTKEFFDHDVYLPEEPTNQLELVGLLDVLAGPLLSSTDAGDVSEKATPISPLKADSVVRFFPLT
ncbi:hypothetical protein [Bdellovibrio svalbardensis]|uniref:Uncharacterized protein n=1 Tax=Bdellovibrio svalbardensis TaxID=2972972 RepID=A0ABT6DHW9_9BACT|nr:hypothetical protein [Bdellovibrio svalbardensis]MDG0816449.1 hypothetical protein [Bdellovibrio svalbardensis]